RAVVADGGECEVVVAVERGPAGDTTLILGNEAVASVLRERVLDPPRLELRLSEHRKIATLEKREDRVDVLRRCLPDRHGFTVSTEGLIRSPCACRRGRSCEPERRSRQPGPAC